MIDFALCRMAGRTASCGTALIGGVLVALSAVTSGQESPADGATSIGSRRELFVDHALIERLDGARLELGRPRPAGVTIAYDKPWEGEFSFYTTVIADGDKFRMYYRGASPEPGYRYAICYAESRDGMHWTKPELGLISIAGSKANNVVLLENQALAPFLDTRPGVPAAERFKGNVFVETRFGAKEAGLLGYVSPDGLHWTPLEGDLLLKAVLKNNFDSQNVMFWSAAEQSYVLFARHTEAGFRAESRATSSDFRHWSAQSLMTYSDTGTKVPSAQLYTSQVQPYFRAPHIYISLPGRLMEGRQALAPADAAELGLNAAGGGISSCADGVLQTTRAGSNCFDRTFLEALVRPGPGRRIGCRAPTTRLAASCRPAPPRCRFSYNVTTVKSRRTWNG